MKKLYIRTFGCQMNEADSDEMALAFQQAGFAPCDTLAQADAILVNTCSVRAHAEHRAMSYIGRLKLWKDRKPGRTVVVAGCAAQRLGKKLRVQFQHVDLVAGAKSIEEFPSLLAAKGITGQAADGVEEPLKAHCAFVTVMRGCSHACSYCIVPTVRGPAKSIPARQVLAAAAAKAARGAKEITLLGQTVNAYSDGEMSFPQLLVNVSRVPGIERVRFMSPHPLYMNEEFTRAMAETPKLARHIHLPVQAGSDRLLSLMKRGYTRAGYLEKIRLLKNAVPDVAISTDFIVGYPSETEEDFAQTLSLVREAGFSFAYCFKYSPREGTLSAALKEGLVPAELAQERLNRLLETVREESRRAASVYADREIEILFESARNGRISQNYWAVCENGARPGELKKALVTGVEEMTLKARILP